MEWKRINEQVETKDDDWFVIHDSEGEKSLIHEETDDDYIVGTFLIKEIISEMGDQIGVITRPHEYFVAVKSNEGMTPHFHIYDAEGRNPNSDKGTHACVQILDNMYFDHGCYNGRLDAKMRKALNVFMDEIRTEDEHSSGIGLTNFVHTINEWNEQNRLRKGMPNWVDKALVNKPDYTKIRPNK